MNFSGTDTVLNAPLKKKVSYNRVFETAPTFGDKEKFEITKGEFGYSASVFIPKFSGYIMEADDGTIKIEFKE